MNKELLTGLEKELPPIVFRNWRKWADFITFSPRRLVNEDSHGTGPDERIVIGRAVGYSRRSLINWMEGKVR